MGVWILTAYRRLTGGVAEYFDRFLDKGDEEPSHKEILPAEQIYGSRNPKQQVSDLFLVDFSSLKDYEVLINFFISGMMRMLRSECYFVFIFPDIFSEELIDRMKVKKIWEEDGRYSDMWTLNGFQNTFIDKNHMWRI